MAHRRVKILPSTPQQVKNAVVQAERTESEMALYLKDHSKPEN